VSRSRVSLVAISILIPMSSLATNALANEIPNAAPIGQATTSVPTLLVSPALGFIGGLLSAFLLQTWGKWDDRRKYSLLGVSIIDELIAEINKGLEILEDLARGKDPPLLMPHAVWRGMETIPNEVMLRIVSMSRGRGRHGEHRISDIRTHCNNYFLYICCHINGSRASGSPISPSTASQFSKDTKMVMNMLHRAKSLLIRNSYKLWRPK
jgi:hypothetical protein